MRESESLRFFYFYFFFFIGLMVGHERGVRDWKSLESEFESFFFFFWVTKYDQIRIPFKFIQIAAYSFHKGICDYLIFFFFDNRIFRYIGVFWVNIAKLEVNLRYRYCSKLFGILRREIEFRYYRCRNLTKSMREKKKNVERESVEFWQRWYRISSAQFCCPCVECSKWKGKNKKIKIDKRIVAMPLPK